MANLSDLWRRRPALCVALAVALIALVRLGIVLATPLELGPDEAQYWRWSRTLDWGYYSKPPLIAWVIAATTSVFGNAEWAVRLAVPFLHAATAFFLFLLGRNMARDADGAPGNVTGAWAAAIYLLMPGVTLSSVVISTDAVLLPFWSAALLALWSLRERPGVVNGALAGLMIGLAMLGKYAALYIGAGAILAALFDRQTRAALLSFGGLAMLAVATLTLAPNLLWNAANGFETVAHTTDNANWNEATFNILNLVKYMTDQMGVFGPIAFVLLLAAFYRTARRRDAEGLADETAGRLPVRELWLICFIAPVLVLIAVQAVISRAHANWAATAYPAASVLLALLATRAGWRNWVRASVILNIVIAGVAAALIVLPSLGDAIGLGNGYKRVRGWGETAREIQARAAAEGATAIMIDEREVWHGVDYYSRDLGGDIPLRAWRRHDNPRSTAEEIGTMQPGEDARILIASVRTRFRARIRADFDRIEDAGTLEIPLGGGKTRRIVLFLASGYHPLPRTPDYERAYELADPDDAADADAG
ncbi:MAG: glycosyltransferase family 39 protein [Hyphomonadaceae bacterium]